MADINNVTLVGNITKDLELKYTSGGTAVLNFSIAVNRYVQKAEKVCFFECVCFSHNAEYLSKYAQKGTKCAVQGELNQDSWEKDGVKHYKVNITVNNITIMSSSRKEGNDNGSYNHGKNQPNMHEESNAQPELSSGSFPEQIPF